MVNSLTCLAISVIIDCACNLTKDQISNRDLLVIGGLGMMTAVSKQVYLFIPWLCFLIPPQKFGDRNRYWISCFLITLAAMLSWLLWSAIIKTHVGIPTNPAPGVSIDRQIQFLFTHPLTLFTLASNCLQEIERPIREFIGVLGWLDAPVPAVVAISYSHLLVFVAIVSGQSTFVITAAQKLKIFLVLVIIIFLIYLSQYLTWTPLGAVRVQGLQGRYFIPIAPLFFLLFYNHRFSCKISEKTCHSYLIAYLLFALTASAIAIFDRYY